tara:strand:- start:5327 stop:6568 length:1242 start_codon:yes stop_codon:yes gene_type:complete
MNTRLPLTGLRVIDFGTAWAAPMATQLLADYGAEVIKVETNTRLDGLRLGRPMIGDDLSGGDRGLWPELQPVFHGINRNKLSITVDMKTSEGIKIIQDLIAQSDVIINNYSPGVLDRLGLNYDSLVKLKPDIILVSMPAVGDVGPMKDVLAYAPIIQALSGLMSLVGYDEEEQLVGELQAPWSDVVAAVHAALATISSIIYRNNTGQGQYIEVSQLEATTSMLGLGFLQTQIYGTSPVPLGNKGMFAPNNNYRCAGDDRWISIAVQNEQQWQGFVKYANSQGWDVPDVFATNEIRIDNVLELDAWISERLIQLDREELVETLQGLGVPAMAVMNIEDQFIDPHWQEREAYAEIEHPHIGIEWIYGMPWLLSATPGSVRTAAPGLGDHNHYVYHDLLGMSEEYIAHLIETKVIN